MTKKIGCVYHSVDLDGWTSARIVQKYHKDNFPDHEVTMIGYNYGEPVPSNLLGFDVLYMVDVCLPKEDMIALFKMYKDRFHWIDHHVSQIKELEGIEITGFRNIKFAACELTWLYLFPDYVIPEHVRLLGRYDCFGQKGTDEERKVLEYQYYARSVASNIETVPDYWLKSGDEKPIYQEKKEVIDNLGKGKVIYAYLCNMAIGDYCNRFMVEFDGLKFACLNINRFNPINFGIDYHKDGYDGFACCWYLGPNKGWAWSLYNDNGEVNVSEICKRRGGGGHAGAAGFREMELFSMTGSELGAEI